MAQGAPKGNQFWKIRTKHGRDKLFSDPQILFEEACKYFQWITDNPLKEQKIFCNQGEIKKTDKELMRPFTLTGLCLFLKISGDTLRNYKKRKDFFEVVKEIEDIVYTQKFEGAAADLLNSNIIARDLGLVDKQRIDNTNVTATTDDPIEEMKKRGIPVPDVEGEDIE